MIYSFKATPVWNSCTTFWYNCSVVDALRALFYGSASIMLARTWVGFRGFESHRDDSTVRRFSLPIVWLAVFFSLFYFFMELPLACGSSHEDSVSIGISRGFVRGGCMFSRKMFPRNECFQHFVLLEMWIILKKYGYLKYRTGVAFSPLYASMVLCSIRSRAPWVDAEALVQLGDGDGTIGTPFAATAFQLSVACIFSRYAISFIAVELPLFTPGGEVNSPDSKEGGVKYFWIYRSGKSA